MATEENTASEKDVVQSAKEGGNSPLNNIKSIIKNKDALLKLILKYKLIILIGFLAIILIIGGFFVWKKFFASTKQNKEIKKDETIVKNGEQKILGINELPGSIISLGQFIVNLNDFTEKHILKIGISIEMESVNSDNDAEVKVREAQLKDIVISIVSTRNSVDILTPQEKEKMKKELLAGINGALKKGKVVNIFFTDFVVQ
ncbi:flagellar basal body-associated FliL family protein [Candidatus Poribacteria bacterium]|nr:flagellar basal body-associated FliL family protein [Candidatus Poribacteria bacterium]